MRRRWSQINHSAPLFMLEIDIKQPTTNTDTYAHVSAMFLTKCPCLKLQGTRSE